MSPLVLDASVVAAAFFQEPHADAARALLISGGVLHAPDLIYAELGNVIWKRQRRGEIEPDEGVELMENILSLPLSITPAEDLVAAALRVAMRTDRTVYDCLYLALAIEQKTSLVSGDKRLVNALAATPLGRHVRWIGDGD